MNNPLIFIRLCVIEAFTLSLSIQYVYCDMYIAIPLQRLLLSAFILICVRVLVADNPYFICWQLQPFTCMHQKISAKSKNTIYGIDS